MYCGTRYGASVLVYCRLTVSEKSILNAGTILLVNRLDSVRLCTSTAVRPGMGALGLNMGPEGRNIAAHAPKSMAAGGGRYGSQYGSQY